MKSKEKYFIRFVSNKEITDSQVFEADTNFLKRTFGKTKCELVAQGDCPDVYVKIQDTKKQRIPPLRYKPFSESSNSFLKGIKEANINEKCHYIFVSNKAFEDIYNKTNSKDRSSGSEYKTFTVDNVSFETISESRAMQESYEPTIRSAMKYAKKSFIVSSILGSISVVLGVLSLIIGCIQIA